MTPSLLVFLSQHSEVAGFHEPNPNRYFLPSQRCPCFILVVCAAVAKLLNTYPMQCMLYRGLFGLPVHHVVPSESVWNSLGLCGSSSSSSSSSSSRCSRSISSSISSSRCSRSISSSGRSSSRSRHLASPCSCLQCLYNSGKVGQG